MRDPPSHSCGLVGLSRKRYEGFNHAMTARGMRWPYYGTGEVSRCVIELASEPASPDLEMEPKVHAVVVALLHARLCM
jgi:hypothetical protein